MITTFVAFFAFGYCITDMVLRIRANKRMDEQFLDQLNNFDD